MSDGLRAFLAEAKRRRVFRTAGVYLVAVWGLSQGAIEIGAFFGVPDWSVRALVLAALAFLPVVVVLAWMFDIGRAGIVRDPQDVRAHEDLEDHIANMATIIDGEAGNGAVIARWQDAEGTKAAIFVDEFLLGRANDCLVRFYDPLVSRRHARVYHHDGEWRIEDLGSRNGTLIDGERIERSILPAQCEVRINEAGPELRFERIPSGPELQRAMAAFPPGQRVAHIRAEAPGADGSPDAGARATLRSRR